MTCIAGLRHNGKTYLACDSQITWGLTKEQIATKIIRTKNLLIANCGHAADAYALGRRFREPAMLVDRDSWLLDSVPDAIRKAIGDARLLRTSEGKEGCDSNWIIGTADGLYSMCSRFALYPATSGYIALGSGGQAGLGSLYSTTGKPEKRLETAIAAANMWSDGCSGEVLVESIGGA